jgi:ubiquinol-cytochrome c reductase iron-sulfur subunit
MSLSTKATSSLVRHAARQQLPAIRSSAAIRTYADASTSTHEYSSPFSRGVSGKQDTTAIPSFSKYRSSGGETGNKLFQYFMVGAMGGVSALGAKNTVQGEHQHQDMTISRSNG